MANLAPKPDSSAFFACTGLHAGRTLLRCRPPVVEEDRNAVVEAVRHNDVWPQELKAKSRTLAEAKTAVPLRYASITSIPAPARVSEVPGCD